jgi:hypothetical protein
VNSSTVDAKKGGVADRQQGPEAKVPAYRKFGIEKMTK